MKRKFKLVVSGTVEQWSGYTFVNARSDLDDAEYLSSGITGKLSLPLGDLLSLQMDGDFQYTSNSFEDTRQDDEFYHSWQMGGHFSLRDPEFGLIGVFGAVGAGTATDVSGPDIPSNTGYVVGGEAQLYWNQLTLYVQSGFIDGTADDQPGSSSTDAVHDILYGRGVLRWFLSGESRLQLEASYASGSQDAGSDINVDIVEWWVRYDTVLHELPVIGDTPVFIAYRGAHFETDEIDAPAEYWENTVMVGTSFKFGASNLREFDLVGATLDLPGFARWIASGQPLD